MKELDFINKYLGGHKITINGFKTIIEKIRKTEREGNKQISIYEIGCGGGDNLRVLKKYCEKEKIPAEFSGIDINPHCIEFARSRNENHNIRFFTSDYKLIHFQQKPDVIFCSLFCHHFSDQEIPDILKWMKKNSTFGFFINDLNRHPFAYYSIKYLAKIFSKSYLVKNDACLSVLRGFKRNELELFQVQSSITNMQLQWKWAFRWLLIYSHE
ncbi:MAG: methyltransferase domain-containing protein [Chitinophagales bacterium]